MFSSCSNPPECVLVLAVFALLQSNASSKCSLNISSTSKGKKKNVVVIVIFNFRDSGTLLGVSVFSVDSFETNKTTKEIEIL